MEVLELPQSLTEDNLAEFLEKLEEAELVNLFNGLEEKQKIKIYQILSEKNRRYLENRLKYFTPNSHQRKFLNATLAHEELYLSGGNRTGKTTTGGLGVAIWATGRYPRWWTGKKFEHPVRIMVLGDSDKQLRRAAQRILLGEEGQFGVGMLPKETIIGEDGKPMIAMKKDPKGAIDYIKVTNQYGGFSYIYFCTYNQGREAVQGDEIHVIWCDEPPKDDIYGELLARIMTTDGVIFTTATPMTGMTEVFNRFVDIDETEDSEAFNRRYFMSVSQHEVDHLSEEQKKRFWDQVPPHERQARIHGLPVLGEGQVYQCTHEQLLCEPFNIKEYDWYRFIIGIDFGFNDPTAAVLCMQDPNSGGKIYVVRFYKQKFKNVDHHAIRLKAWGAGIPVSWPRDGHRVLQGARSMITIKDQYRKCGLQMNPKPAFSTYSAPKEGSNLEAGVQIVYELIHSDQLKIFDTPECRPLVKAMVMYHRKDGKIAPYQDDHGPDALRSAVCEIKRAKPGYGLGRGIEREKKNKKYKTSFSLN